VKSSIYIIRNLVNNKVYVGSAVNTDKRWSQHKHSLKEGKHHSCLLQRVWDKYGEQNFKFEIIQEVQNPIHLLSYEQVFLDYYKSYEHDKGYNICKIAGSPFGLKRSDEAKQKMREAKKNISEETKQRLRQVNIGKKHSDETKQRMREANIGKKHSEETKKKIRNSAKNLSEETRQKMRDAAKNMTEEHKQKLREAHTGKKLSDETKQKMSKARTGKKRSGKNKDKQI